MDVLADLDARGLIHDTTDREALAARLAEGPTTVYYGCDPTADSLHVGNLIGLLVLRRLAEAGHRPIALAGGATGMVGDPSGRSSERNLLDEDTLRANVAAIKDQITAVLGDGFTLVDNYSWTRDLSVLAFLRDVGKHATVNQMLARESVKARLGSEHGISYTEFTYMLLQANDYRWLHEHEGCELQIGGSDQWGNILSGVDLIRRVSGSTVHALCWPLLTAPDGTKLGKTTGARVWLSAARTSPYQFFQHWMGTDDRQVEEFLLKFTLLPVESAGEIARAHLADPGRRLGQRRLAREVTALVHGEAAAATAEAVSSVLFGGSVEALDEPTFEALASEVPTVSLPAASVVGPELADVLAAAGLCTSKSEARRLLDQGGVYVNNRRPAGDRLADGDLRYARYVLLRRGKADYRLVVISS